MKKFLATALTAVLLPSFAVGAQAPEPVVPVITAIPAAAAPVPPADAPLTTVALPIPEIRAIPAAAPQPPTPVSTEPAATLQSVDPQAACPPVEPTGPVQERPEAPQGTAADAPMPFIFTGDSINPFEPGTDMDPTEAMKTIIVPERKEVAAIIKEFNSIGRSTMSLSLGRAGKYLPLIRDELQALGLPEELAALPLVESSYNPLAVSTAGAVGLWQFVAATARLNGLRVDWWVDERLDPIASTKAAARHLKDLYDHYGDWNLALAAYNAGSGFVDRAGGAREGADFWKLCNADRIRSQTRRYVPKFYAAMAIMGDPLAHGYDPMDETGAFAYDEVPVSSPVSLAVVAERAGISFEELSVINPGLKRGCTPPGDKPYLMRVPRGMGERIAFLLADIPDSERLLFRRHKIQAGESIGKIAKKYGVDSEAITLLNNIKDKTKLKAGDELVIPVGGQKKSRAVEEAAKAKPGASLAHVVAKGDTLSSVAKRYGLTLARIRELNNVGENEVLQPGDRLVVGPKSE